MGDLQAIAAPRRSMHNDQKYIGCVAGYQIDGTIPFSHRWSGMKLVYTDHGQIYNKLP